jgi:hypothetical protein
MYENGFIVEEEEFYSYSAPLSRPILRALARAEIPDEWTSRFDGQTKLGVNLLDRRSEKYQNLQKSSGKSLLTELGVLEQKTWHPSASSVCPSQKPSTSSNNRVATLHEPLPKRNSLLH